MTRAIVKKVLHPSITYLKKQGAGSGHLRLAGELLGLDVPVKP
jgi:hypothetical protein